MKTKRVLLVDDHPLMREGIASMIASQPDMEVVGEASDVLEAMIKAKELSPDLILMDIQMPGIDGIEATRQIIKDLPAVVIVMLTVRDDEEKLFEAIKCGARGYLLKNIRSSQMIEMLRGALRGEAALSPVMAMHVLDVFRQINGVEVHVPDEQFDSLTQREEQVLILVSQGATNKEIGKELCISLHTVKSHIRNILSKLQVKNRREAARLAQNKGFI